MGAASVQRKRSTPVAQDELDQSLAVFAARKDFVSGAVNMGWQLALTVVVPVIVGVKLDERFHSTPSYTLAALMLAAFGASMVVWATFKQTAVKQAKRGKK